MFHRSYLEKKQDYSDVNHVPSFPFHVNLGHKELGSTGMIICSGTISRGCLEPNNVDFTKIIYFSHWLICIMSLYHSKIIVLRN